MKITKSTLCVFVCLMMLVVMAGRTQGAQSIANTLVVGTGGSTIITVLGCMERFLCQGEGTHIRWRFFGTRTDVTNTTTRRITTSVTGNTVSSHLTFTNVLPEHGDLYVCNIINQESGFTTTLVARLTVNNTRVYIEPINDINITSNTIGDTVSFGCSIQTCEETILVQIMKGSRLLQNMTYTGRNLVLINHDLTISGSTAGAYACRVLLTDGSTIMQNFSITGTPQIPPAPPTTVAPTNGGGSSNPTTKNGATSSLKFYLTLPLSLFLLSLYTISKL